MSVSAKPELIARLRLYREAALIRNCGKCSFDHRQRMKLLHFITLVNALANTNNEQHSFF